MIREIGGVFRGEGAGSVVTRSAERIGEALRHSSRLACGLLASARHTPIINVVATPPSSRLGGVQIQLVNRLREEKRLRPVTLLYPGVLEQGFGAWRRRDYRPPMDQAALRAVARTSAKGVILDGTHGMSAEGLLQIDTLILSLHDLSLTGDPAGARLLQHARAVIFPSEYLLERYREHFNLSHPIMRVIEPGTASHPATRSPARIRTRIAYAGSVKRHKGGHLLPDIIAATPGVEWHLFGGGDEDLLQAVRRLPGVSIHGYYRAGALPSLLTRHRISLAVLPSVVPESYSLTLSECWLGGVPVVAFAHGAQAERIMRDGGGWLVRPDEGAMGIVKVIQDWIDGRLSPDVPTDIEEPRHAAEAHVELYRELGLIG